MYLPKTKSRKKVPRNLAFFDRAAVCFLALFSLFAGCDRPRPHPQADAAYHVYPGDDIQAALEAAARDPIHKTVKVHAGTYRPQRPGQALIFFAARHDGIALEAVGRVVLTAAHAERADPNAASYPAIVNHVVFFGDGISRRTVLRGFTITGANNFASRNEGPEPIQPDSSNGVRWEKGLFFYADGGGIKVFGRSYPTLKDLAIHDNYASPCGGGISIEHRGFDAEAVRIENSVFRNNRCQITGAAVDVLPGSAVVLDNCLFVGNVANLGPDYVGRGGGGEYNKAHGSGALTVFPGARVEVRDCTFTDNWNGVDDKGRGSAYRNTIFWMNVRAGGIAPGSRYEVDLLDSRRFSGCFVRGQIDDLRGTLDPKRNVLQAPNPQFDENYRPQAPAYAGVGYRPAEE